MTTTVPTRGAGRLEDTEHLNCVELVGRLAAPAAERVLPSGDRLVQFRLVVSRPARGHGVAVDTVDCAAWTATLRRKVQAWQEGDLIGVTGALRRRFWRSAAGSPASRYEVEVGAARRVRRATMAG